MPLPRDAELLPDAIVEEIQQDVRVHMIRIEASAPKATPSIIGHIIEAQK